VFEKSLGYRILSLLFILVAGASTGCQTIGEETYVKVHPKTQVRRTSTSFSGALRCMDDLFVSHGVSSVPITTVGIEDATGQARAGMRDMLITSIAKMSERSGAFKYVDWEYENKELQVLFQQARDANQGAFEANYENPRYYIRGGITQFDRNVAEKGYGGGVAAQYDDYTGDLVADWRTGATVLALDMNVGSILERRIVPGLSSNNSLAVNQKGGALAGALSNVDLGVTFDFQANEAEGPHLAIRTLVELGAIETLGKLTRVPYWSCLEVESTEPGVLEELNDWWNDMDGEERQRFAERALVANGYLAGPADGRVDRDARNAIARYQAENDLVVTGRAGFELYKSLIGSDRPLSAGPPQSFAAEMRDPDPVADAMPVRAPVQIEIFSERGASPTYAPMESLRASLQVSGNAYVSCFYQQSDGEVLRVFPNRFQPDAHVAAGEIVSIPGPSAGFKIRLENPGQEELMCIASDRELAHHLPRELQGRDLVPMPVESLDALAEHFDEIDRTAVSQARLEVNVAGM
jgi:hypothetical protein